MEIKKSIKLAWSYITYKKRRTLFTLFILSFSIMGFILINQMSDLYKVANIELVGINEGYQDFALKNPTDKNLKDLEREARVNRIGNEWVIGSGTTEFGPSILIYRDANYNDIDPSLSVITEGESPRKEDEIAITQAFAMDNNVGIGDQITINFTKVDNESRTELYSRNKAFDIVGIIDAPAYAYEVGMVSSAMKDSYGIEVANSVITLNNSKNVTDQIDRIQSNTDINPEKISINQSMLAAHEDNKNVQLFNDMMNMVVFITFGLVIYNLLYFETLAKTKDFGILRCIGYQSSQLGVAMVMQVVIYLGIAFLIAVTMATGLNRVLAKLITQLLENQLGGSLDGFSAAIKLSIIIKSFLLAVMTIIPSIVMPIHSIRKISPKEAMSYNKEMGRVNQTKAGGSDKLIHAKDKLKVYSMKCVQRYPRKFFITTCIIFLSGLLISGIVAFNGTGQIDVEWIKGWIPGDIKVEDSHMQNLVNTEVSNYETFDENVLSEISAIEGVSKIEAIQVNANFIVFDSATINKESNLYRMYESEFTRNGSEDHEERQFVNVYGTDDMKHYLGDKTDQGEGVVIDREFADFLNVKLNDSIRMLSDSDNRVIELPIVSIVGDEFPIKNTSEGISSVLMPMKLMEKITGRNTKDRVDIWIDAGAEQNHVKQQLMTIQEISQRGTVTTFNDYAADFYKEQKTKQSLLLIVGVTFLVILLVTCFNAIANNFSNRAKETAILYVVGIDKQSIVKAYLQEGLFCIRRGVLFTVLVQSCILLMGKNFFDIDGLTVAIYVLLDLGILVFGLLSTMVFANKLTQNIQLRDLQYE